MRQPIRSAAAAPASKAWALKSEHVVSEIQRLAAGPNLRLLELGRLASEVRAVLLLKTPTLVCQPGQAPAFRGPVVVGFRYHERWLSQAPVPWEVMTILEPLDIFLPSVSPAAGARKLPRSTKRT